MTAALVEFRRRVKSGMRPGKAARAAFGRHLGDKAVQELAELAELEFSISSDYASFVNAYADVRSCMIGRGGMCHEFYSKLGVEIATLRSSAGPVVARALIAGRRYCNAYGDKHYVLEALLSALGFEQSDDWLKGRTFSVQRKTSSVQQWALIGGVRAYETVAIRHVRYYLKRGWKVAIFAGVPYPLMVRDGHIYRVGSTGEFIVRMNEGWAPADSVMMYLEIPRRSIVVSYETTEEIVYPQTPYVDGYNNRIEELFCVEFNGDDDDDAAWHPYEWAEQYAA